MFARKIRLALMLLYSQVGLIGKCFMVEQQSHNVSSNDICTYVDYRSFLRDYFNSEKTRDPQWSFGIWARRLQVKSKSSLTMIMKGQRRPGPGIFEKMCQYFGFNQEQREHFRRLLKLEKQTKNPSAQKIMEDLLSQEPRPTTSEEVRRLIHEFDSRMSEISN